MRQNESGNVFVYIFMAVALLAGLSFAVSEGGRVTGSQLTQDTRNLVATEIIGYSDTVAKAVTQLRLRGSRINQLSFANMVLPSADYGDYDCVDPPDTCPAGTGAADEIFNPAGGAVVYQSPPAPATTTGSEEYQFLANNEVARIGTTCGGADCSDLLMVIPNIRLEICTQLNDLLGVANPGGVPPTDSDIREDETFKPAAGPFGYDETIGDEDAALDGQSEACFQETDDSEYVYYKVLLPR